MMVRNLPHPYPFPQKRDHPRAISLVCGIHTDHADVYPGAAEENIGIDMDEDDGDGVPARLELGFGEGDLGVRMPLPVYRARGC